MLICNQNNYPSIGSRHNRSPQVIQALLWISDYGRGMLRKINLVITCFRCCSQFKFLSDNKPMILFSFITCAITLSSTKKFQRQSNLLLIVKNNKFLRCLYFIANYNFAATLLIDPIDHYISHLHYGVKLISIREYARSVIGVETKIGVHILNCILRKK